MMGYYLSVGPQGNVTIILLLSLNVSSGLAVLNTSNYNLEWFGRKAGIALCCTFHPIKNQVRCALMCLIMNIFVCVHEYSCTCI